MKIVPVFFALLTGGFGRKHQKSRTHQSNSKEALPKTCHDIFTKSAEKCQVADNGFYEIKPAKWLRPKWVECIFTDRGWTVLQSRYNGGENFDRNFKAYKYGFGCLIGDGQWDSTDCEGEVWLGLEFIYWIQRVFGKPGSKLCSYIAGSDPGNYEYLCYDTFQIHNGKNNYKILRIDGFNGFSDVTTLPNAFRGLDTIVKENEEAQYGNREDLLGASFSAPDVDNDDSSTHCAKQQKSGWWFKDCSAVNLNGDWTGRTGNGIFWADNSGRWTNLKRTKVFIGPHTSKLTKYPKCGNNKN